MAHKGPVPPSTPSQAKDEAPHRTNAQSYCPKYGYLRWSDILGHK